MEIIIFDVFCVIDIFCFLFFVSILFIVEFSNCCHCLHTPVYNMESGKSINIDSPSELEQVSLRCELLTRELTVQAENHATSLRALTMCQGVLARLASPLVRKDFLSGKFGVAINSHLMLQSLDSIADIMLPCPSVAGEPVRDGAATVGFIVRLLSKDSGEPLDRMGLHLPIRLSYKMWREYLHELMSSKYWESGSAELLHRDSNMSVSGVTSDLLINVNVPVERENFAVYGDCDRACRESSISQSSCSVELGRVPVDVVSRGVSSAGGAVEFCVASSCSGSMWGTLSHSVGAPSCGAGPVYVQSGYGAAAGISSLPFSARNTLYPYSCNIASRAPPEMSVFEFSPNFSCPSTKSPHPAARVPISCIRDHIGYSPEPLWGSYRDSRVPNGSSNEQPNLLPTHLHGVYPQVSLPVNGRDFPSSSRGDYRSRPRSLSTDSNSLGAGSIDSGPHAPVVSAVERLGRTPEPADLTLLAAIKQLRVKEPVAPRKFNLDSGKSFERFLNAFERYFDIKFDGTDYDKSSKLSAFLEGSVLKAYEGLDGSDVPYPKLRMQLLDWYTNARTTPSQSSFVEFQRASYDGDGSLGVYCTRLEKLACKAFPGSEKEREQYLSRKFRSTIPPTILSKLENALSSFAVLGTRKFTWKQIRSFAEGEDRLAKQRYEDQLVVGRPSEQLSTVYYTRQLWNDGAVADGVVSRPAVFRPSLLPVSVTDEVRSGAGGARPKQRTTTFEKNSPFRDRSFSKRSPPPRQKTRRSPPICAWCGRLGHAESDCWLKLGACLACGDASHSTTDCERAIESNSVPKLRCSRCNGDHLGMKCMSREPGLYPKRDSLNL